MFIMMVQQTNLQQLCDAAMLPWTKVFEGRFRHYVESML